jgi:hypothetical protein
MSSSFGNSLILFLKTCHPVLEIASCDFLSSIFSRFLPFERAGTDSVLRVSRSCECWMILTVPGTNPDGLPGAASTTVLGSHRLIGLFMIAPASSTKHIKLYRYMRKIVDGIWNDSAGTPD